MKARQLHYLKGGTQMQKMHMRTIVPLDFDIFCGLDVDAPGISSLFIDHKHELYQSVRMPNDPQNLIRYVQKHFKGKIAFAYESGPTGYGLYDALTAAGYYCMVVAASKVPRVEGQSVKTNRLDAKKIAEGLRAGQLKSINIPSLLYRNLRHLVQMRNICVSYATASKSRIRMLLLYESIKFPAPEHTSPWSRSVIAELEKLECSPTVRFKLNTLLAALRYHKEQLRITMRQIRAYCKQSKELSFNIALVKSISGLGVATAVEIIARIGDWRFLSNVRQLPAFLGLVPREKSTGDTVRRGHITRAGHGRTRAKLIQCAWIAIRKDPELQSFYKRMLNTHCRDYAAKKAIVAVARKLATRIYAVLRNQRPYVVHHTTSPDSAYSPQGTTRSWIEPVRHSAC
jgi:transposase